MLRGNYAQRKDLIQMHPVQREVQSPRRGVYGIRPVHAKEMPEV